MKFGALRGSSTSAKSDADEYFNITINYTFKMQQSPFPINTTVVRYRVVELFMSDVDGYAETVVSLAYASTAIQCWRNVNHRWVKFDTASPYPSLYHYKQLYFENGTDFSQ